MKIYNSVLKITAVLAVVFSFIACSDDFSEVGSDIIADNNFQTMLYDSAYVGVETYELDAVQTNLLPTNILGVYNDPVYGQRTASILTQLSLQEYPPDFGVNPVLDSVVLTLPYFSTEIGRTEDNVPLYELDSVYGDQPYHLKISKSNYFLSDYDPETDFEEIQKYYSNQGEEIENNISEEIIFYQDSTFVPSAESIVTVAEVDGEDETSYSKPALRVNLTERFGDFFTENIIENTGSAELMNSNNFKNFLRGLYIQAIPTGGEGNMMLLNLSDAKAGIRLYYSYDAVDEHTGETTDEREEAAFVVGFNGTRVNVLDDNFTLPEDDNIYLEGGEGTLAVIDLFTEEQLEDLRDNEWLINEANLVFYVNQDVMEGSIGEPERIYLYDFNKNTPVIDYYYDLGTYPSGLTKLGHFGQLERDANGNGIRYKIKITDHVSHILNRDSTNTKLGLVVSQNIDFTATSAVKDNENVEKVPSASIISPEGTVLYGPEATEEEKRLKLNIYYTEID